MFAFNVWVVWSTTDRRSQGLEGHKGSQGAQGSSRTKCTAANILSIITSSRRAKLGPSNLKVKNQGLVTSTSAHTFCFPHCAMNTMGICALNNRGLTAVSFSSALTPFYTWLDEHITHWAVTGWFASDLQNLKNIIDVFRNITFLLKYPPKIWFRINLMQKKPCQNEKRQMHLQ